MQKYDYFIEITHSFSIIRTLTIMIIFKQSDRIYQHLQALQKMGKSIGFVPTMGALHAGHLSLVSQSIMDNDISVCSIFVNPKQFNNSSDLQHYPVTIEQDIELLEAAGCDVLFLPSYTEIYPDHYKQKIGRAHV